jgi:hypothetical protein
VTHCNCDDCKHDRELLASVRELLPLLLAIARAQAMAAQTVANKWRDGEGETAFRKMNEQKKHDIITERIPVNV